MIKTGVLAALARKVENGEKKETDSEKLGYSKSESNDEGRPPLVEGEVTIRKGYTINEGLYLEMQRRMEALGYTKDSEYLRLLIAMDVRGKAISKLLAQKDAEIRMLKNRMNRKSAVASEKGKKSRLARKERKHG